VPRNARTNSAARPSIQDRALAPAFIRRCTSEHRNESIAFPKLNVVLVMHLLGSASRRLLVNAVELCSADHLPAAVHHEHLVPHSAVRSQGRPSSYSNARLRHCQTRLWRTEPLYVLQFGYISSWNPPIARRLYLVSKLPQWRNLHACRSVRLELKSERPPSVISSTPNQAVQLRDSSRASAVRAPSGIS